MLYETAPASPVRKILVTGATGKQGGATVRALLAAHLPFKCKVLGLTRNPTSNSAKKLVADTGVHLLEGDFDNIDDVFEKAGGHDSVWGVFSVQVPSTAASKGCEDQETVQGKALIDAAIKYGVEHFVYSSVDRRGLDSLNNPTQMAHFISKHKVELHLIDQATDSHMSYTILRPVAFMDNFKPCTIYRVLTAMWAQMGDTKLQVVATKDIGILAAKAFAAHSTDDYKNTAISLAGDELSYSEANDISWKVLKRPLSQSYWVLADILKWMVPDVRLMFQWFEDVGYAADIEQCRRLNPQMLDYAAWLEQESNFGKW